MHYTKQLQTALLLCILFWSSCKKEDAHTPDPAYLRVKTVTDKTGNVLQYTYDGQNRLVKAEGVGMFYKEEMKYEPGKATWTLTNVDGSFTADYMLNTDGLAISKPQDGGNTLYYEYDNRQRLIRTYDGGLVPSETKHYYNAATGLKDSMRTTKGGLWQFSTWFMYYEDKTNTTGDDNFGRTYYGRQFPKPIKSIVLRRPDGNQVKVSVTNYTYTYDAQNRIASRTFTGNGQSGTETYTYY
ncbi:hypothetical protein [Niabella drilacis]|uniref:YD repeat-containing protein n=1 Tax=Niabella drilacis (strain DSM 25811 / CCM 8410 / CCUG 62505 / LMG 26954 / E90) TaxID=1285928 RepID=A0A1G6WIZ5_NIADE|nr:hypothetical protein [Niabella drilacis]SDD65842.1 YD repeat-containing protein [Niabella drilacis]